MSIYCIKNTKYPDMYWSNDWGWMDTSEDGFEECVFDLFSEDETLRYSLPMDGEWILYCDIDKSIMFAETRG